MMPCREDDQMAKSHLAYMDSKCKDARRMTDFFNASKDKYGDHDLAIYHCERIFGDAFKTDKWIQKNLVGRPSQTPYEQLVERALQKAMRDHRDRDWLARTLYILEEAFIETKIPEYLLYAGDLLFDNDFYNLAFSAYHTAFKRRPDPMVGVCVWTCLFMQKKEDMADWLLSPGPDMIPTVWLTSAERHWTSRLNFVDEPPVPMPRIWYTLAQRLNASSAIKDQTIEMDRPAHSEYRYQHPTSPRSPLSRSPISPR